MIIPNPELDTAQLQEIISLEHVLHPLAEPVDYYKLLFQAAYGPSHMSPDQQTVYNCLKAELSSLADDYRPYFQDIGSGTAFIRISLSIINQAQSELQFSKIEEQAELLTALIMKSRLQTGISPRHWKQVWDKAKPLVEKFLPFRSADRELIDSLLNNDVIPHHSEQFRSSYMPHYRIIHRDLLPELETGLGINNILELR